jgi:hypothetical protein
MLADVERRRLQLEWIRQRCLSKIVKAKGKYEMEKSGHLS